MALPLAARVPLSIDAESGCRYARAGIPKTQPMKKILRILAASATAVLIALPAVAAQLGEEIGIALYSARPRVAPAAARE